MVYVDYWRNSILEKSLRHRNDLSVQVGWLTVPSLEENI